MRPLYLGGGAVTVRLEASSLAISVDGEADSRVPLRLLSRVVSPTGVEWSTGALTACLNFGVPVAFVRGDGNPLGLCLPAARRELDLNRRLDALENEAGGRLAFGNWTASEERRAILALLGRAVAQDIGDLRPVLLRNRILAAADNPDRAGSLLLRLEGLVAAHLSSLLIEAGLAAQRAAPAAPGRLDLFSACLAAAKWEVIPALRRCLLHRQLHPDAWASSRQRAKRLTRQYEAAVPQIAASQRRRLRRLDSWLWEMES